MKKWLIPVIIGVWAASLNAGLSFGIAPADLQDSVRVHIVIPSILGLWVSNDSVVFDFNVYVSNGTYPPTNFPAYYNPTTGTAENPNGVGVRVFSNDASTSWALTTWGSGDFSTTVALDQLEYSPAGAATWSQYSTTETQIASGNKTGGWENHDQDLRFRAESDDEPVDAGIYIYYRLYNN